MVLRIRLNLQARETCSTTDCFPALTHVARASANVPVPSAHALSGRLNASSQALCLLPYTNERRAQGTGTGTFCGTLGWERVIGPCLTLVPTTGARETPRRDRSGCSRSR